MGQGGREVCQWLWAVAADAAYGTAAAYLIEERIVDAWMLQYMPVIAEDDLNLFR